MSAARNHDGPDAHGVLISGGSGPTEGDRQKKSVTTRIVGLAERDYRVLLGEDGTAYAVAFDGPNLALPLRGRDGLRQRLARLYYTETGTAASGAALTDALAVLEGAAAEEDREPVALRLARHRDAIVLDLGSADGRCVIVEPGRPWRLSDRSPILFRRTALTGEIAVPVYGGEAEDLGELVNADRRTVRLIIGWLVAALIPEIPHPILGVFGEQGTAKTTLLRLLATLIDPSPAPTRTTPRDLGQWAVTASASWLVALDNISAIPDWLSDAMCRAVTGDGLISRALYSDADVAVLTFRRVLAMTSIDAGALRGDLGDRLLPAELERIAPRARRTDAEIAAEFALAAPRLLGALLDLLAGVLARLPEVCPTELPRMADFARVLHALDIVTGWDTAADYARTATDVAEQVLESDPFATAVRALVPAGHCWSGTAAELLDKVTPEQPPRGWPKSPRGVAGAISRITPALRAVGITVEHGRVAGGKRARVLTLSGPPSDGNPEGPSQPSQGTFDLLGRRDGQGDGWAITGRFGGTVGTVAREPSPQPSHLSHLPDLREQQAGDSWDSRDGSVQDESRPLNTWRRSGEPLRDRA
jgi:hypothetical protein